MITQYTRLIVLKSDQSIEHVTSQDFPFVEGWEPVEYDPLTHEALDFEIVTDFVDANYGIGREQEMIRGRQILDNFEVASGQVQLKASSSVDFQAKVLNISAPKAITEAVVVSEMRASIRATLISGGSSEQVLLDDLRILKPTTPTSLDDMSTLDVVRIDKAVKAAQT